MLGCRCPTLLQYSAVSSECVAIVTANNSFNNRDLAQPARFRMPGFTPRQLCHWGPVVAITLILIVILSASYSAAQLYGLPTVSWLTIPHFVEIYFESGWIIYLYYKALLGPGFVPRGWKPVSLHLALSSLSLVRIPQRQSFLSFAV